MTTVNKNWLVLLGALSLLTAIAMALAPAGPVFEALTTAPIIIGLECLVYFLAALVLNPRATIGMGVVTAIAYAVVRLVCSLIGAGLYSAIAHDVSNFSLDGPYMHPVVVVLQVLVLVLAGPYVLATTVPELVGLEESRRLRGDGPTERPQASVTTSMETSPSGGFIQVFSFEELTAVLRKSPGLEGFIVYNEEGLVVWRDFPLKVDLDVLTASLLGHNIALGHLMVNSGLTRVRRMVLESREHYLLATTLNQNFGLILLFNNRTPQQDIQSRLAILAKTAREFLQWKYPSLPLATGLTRDRVPVDLV